MQEHAYSLPQESNDGEEPDCPYYVLDVGIVEDCWSVRHQGLVIPIAHTCCYGTHLRLCACAPEPNLAAIPVQR